MNRLPLLAAVCAAAMACSSESPGALQPTITDSSGVTIVTVPSLDELPARSLTGPVLELATSEDSSEASISRVGSVLRLPDGRLVVADAASRRLKVFGPDGSYLRALGEAGGDTIDFSAITAIWPADGNRVVAFDQRRRRVGVMSLDGGPVEAHELAVPPGNPRPVGRLSSGEVLLRSLAFQAPVSGFERSDVAILRFGEDGSLADTVGVWESARMGPLGQPPLQLVTSPMFEPRFVGVAAGARLLVSSCRSPEYRVIDPTNGLERIVRWAADRDSVTADDVRSYRARRLGVVDPEQKERIRAFLDLMPVNETMPVCDQIRVDQEGRAWVRTFLRPAAPQQRWLVFDSGGRPLYRIDLPAETLLMDISSEHVTVIERRPLDVLRILVYGIE